MKKLSVLLLVAMVFVITVPNVYAMESSFTHPEIGEYLTIRFKEGMPYFSIYDFLYYEIMSPVDPYRGIASRVYDKPDRKMLDIDDVLSLFFESFAKDDGKDHDVLVYIGINGMYSYELESLPINQKIRAIKLLNGFEGIKGYRDLVSIAGFEHADIEYLESEYYDYSVKIGKTTYPYRVLAFHFEGEDWVEYTERYSFLKISGRWKLLRISKEYTDDYQSRGDYVHGVTGSNPAFIIETNQELMRNITWGMRTEDVETVEGTKAKGQRIVIDNCELFRVPAVLEYSFSSKKLTKMQYYFNSPQAYYSAFISLYMRYSDPVTVSENGDMTWALNDIKVSLIFDETDPSIILETY